MDKSFPCIESTVDFDLNHIYIIRLWINKLQVPEDYSYEKSIVGEIIKYYYKEKPSRIKLLDYIVTLRYLNAVQVQEMDGDIKVGTVIYTVDFAGDVHG